MIRSTRDEASVLSDRFDRMMGTVEFDGLVDQEHALWSPLYRITGTLEKSLPEVFMPDYSAHLDAARERPSGHARRDRPAGGPAGMRTAVVDDKLRKRRGAGKAGARAGAWV